MSYPRFIGTIEDDKVILQNEEFHHAVKVKRVKEGDIIEVNNLCGTVVLAQVENVEKRKLIGKVIKNIPVEEERIKITLYQCIPNHLSKIDDIIEPISELGVYRLVPVICRYTAVKEKDVIKKLNRWKKIAVNSIKQCKRLYPVKIENPIKFVDISPEEDLKIVFYEKEQKKLECFKRKDVLSAGILVGAEGGLTSEEIDTLKKKGFESYSLGKNILRMETAIIAGICQIKFILG